MPSPQDPLFVGVFTREVDVLAAARATRAAGYRIRDAFAPYAVHGLDEAIGLAPSRLPWTTLGYALTGVAFAAAGQYWIGAIDWNLDVGGKPDNSLPAYLPAMFETMVLLAGVGTVVTLLLRCGLRPGRNAWLADARVTDDRFALAVEASEPAFDEQGLTGLWGRFGLSEARALPGKEGSR